MGECCAANVRAMHDQAVRRGFADQLRDLEQKDVESYSKLVVNFGIDCPSKGRGSRRPDFDYVKYLHEYTRGKRNSMLQDQLPLVFEEYVKWWETRPQGFRLNRKAATARWFADIANSKASLVH